jgi:hypothetical protein
MLWEIEHQSSSLVERLAFVPHSASESELLHAWNQPGWFDVTRFRFGFPSRSVSWDLWLGHPQRIGLANSEGHDGCNPTSRVALPRSVISPGFAINTVFDAAVLAVIWFAPGATRRRRRVKPGLCPACAFPVGSSPVCTECGRLVTRQTPKAETPTADSDGTTASRH